MVERKIENRAREFLRRNKKALRDRWFDLLSAVRSVDPRHDEKQNTRRHEFGLNRDSLTLLEQLFHDEPNSLAKDIIEITIERVRTEKFSIVDFLHEINTLKRSVSEGLDAPGIEDAFETYKSINFKLDMVVADVASETAAVFEEVTDRAPSGLCLLDQADNVVYANPAARAMFAGSDLVGANMLELVSPEERGKFAGLKAQGAERYASPKSDLLLNTQQGASKRLTTEIHPLRDARGGSHWFALMTEPHSSSWVTVEALDDFGLGVLRIEDERAVYYANKTACEMVGVINFQPTKVKELVHADDWPGVQKQLDARGEGKPDWYQVRIRRFDREGSFVKLNVVALPETGTDARVVGSIAYVESVEASDVAERIETAVAETRRGADLLECVCREIYSICPTAFIINVYRWNRSMSHSSIVWSVVNGKETMVWPRVWYDMSDGHREWENQGAIIHVEDFEKFLDTPTFRKFKNEESVLQMREMGAASFLRFRFERNGIFFGVALFSKLKGGFTALDAKLIEKLPLDHSIQTALRCLEQEEQAFKLDLLGKLMDCDTFDEIAKLVVDSLAKEYAWNHVSIWRVDEEKGYLRLVNQANGPGKGYKVNKAERRKIGQGLCGRVATATKWEYVEDTEAAKMATGAAKKSRSALAFPLSTRGRPFWVLNIESQSINFMTKEAIKRLEVVGEQINLLLDALGGRQFHDQAMMQAGDGFFVTLKGGKIRHINPAGLRLLGYDTEDQQSEDTGDGLGRAAAELPEPLRGKNIRDIVADEWKADRILSDNFNGNTRVTMRTSDGETTNVLMSRFTVGGHRDGDYFFVCKNLEAEELIAKIEGIRQLYNEIGLQTKMPLSLITGWLSRMESQQTDELDIREFIRRARRQLHRLELTYDRLAYFDAESSKDMSSAIVLDLRHIVDESVDMFEGKFTPIKTCTPEDKATVLGDVFQLRFVLDSWIAHFLRSASSSDPVEVSLTVRGDAACLAVEGAAYDIGPDILNP